MKRREFIAALGGAATWPIIASAQQTDRVRRIGVLMHVTENDPDGQARLTAFVERLKELGWSEGRNLRFDIRWGPNDPDRYPRQAAELAALAPDVLVAPTSFTLAPLQRATRSVPIVFMGVIDPVGAGFVSSLARPGCNRQADHRDARRPALGRVRAGARIDVRLHGASQRRSTGRTLMSGCILVVEDQVDNRQILRDLLGNAGYQLVEAENGEEALAAVAKQRPDLILMDIQLPVMDGYEATRRIRANPDLKSIPIIAVTSYALAGDEAKALAAGCNAYVTKPYSPRHLLAKVREFLPT